MNVMNVWSYEESKGKPALEILKDDNQQPF